MAIKQGRFKFENAKYKVRWMCAFLCFHSDSRGHLSQREFLLFLPHKIMCVKFGSDHGLPYFFYVSVRKIPKYTVLSYALSDFKQFLKDKKLQKCFWSAPRVFPCREWIRSETTMAKEYCWPITQKVTSRCSPSGSSVLEFGCPQWTPW